MRVLLFVGCFFLYSAILCSWADSLHSHLILHEWLAFYSESLNVSWSGVLTVLTWLELHETAAVLAYSVYTLQPCTRSLHAKPHMYSVCMFSCNLPPAFLPEWPGSQVQSPNHWAIPTPQPLKSARQAETKGGCCMMSYWPTVSSLPRTSFNVPGAG